MIDTNIADRVAAGFVVIDYSENPAGNHVFGPATPQACGRYVDVRRLRNSGLVVERTYIYED